jgi:SSS family solute:Na+ symporter
MSPRAIALAIIFTIVLIGSAIGLYAGKRHTMNLEQWTVGGRAFGTLLIWLLMAGEIYTAYSFLGASGWAYSRGGPALYVIAYITLSNVVAFFVLPPVWDLGRQHGLQTLPDFFLLQYRSRYLAAFTALVGVAFMIPYLQIQLTGLGIIMQTASFDAIGRTPAMIIAVVLIASFVFASGIRAVAWVSVLKDFLMLAAVVSVGLAVPHIYFGGIGHMFATLARTHPSHLTMPGDTSNLGHSWFISTVLLSAMGGCMWPHLFGASFTARSADTLRRNAVFMPLYTLSLAFILFTGFTAFLVIPGLTNVDLSLLAIVRKTFPAWILGLVGAAGTLTAMVPASILVLSASTLFAKNLYRPIFAPNMTDDQVARLARLTVLAFSLISLYIAIYSSATLVSILLVGFAGVTQFFPGVVLGLFWKQVRMAGVFCGLIVGVALTALLVLTNRDPYLGFNAGFIAVCSNFAVTILISLLVPARSILPAEQLATTNP